VKSTSNGLEDLTNSGFQLFCTVTHYSSVSQSFMAGALFSDKQISIAPLPCLAHISTQFFHAFHYET